MGSDGVEMVFPYGAELKSKIIEETTRLGIEIIGLFGGVIKGVVVFTGELSL